MNILINFFASLYDLAIAVFAFIYDLVHDFIVFLGDYIKWTTNLSAPKSNDFSTNPEKPIQVHNQNNFDIR